MRNKFEIDQKYFITSTCSFFLSNLSFLNRSNLVLNFFNDTQTNFGVCLLSVLTVFIPLTFKKPNISFDEKPIVFNSFINSSLRILSSDILKIPNFDVSSVKLNLNLYKAFE